MKNNIFQFPNRKPTFESKQDEARYNRLLTYQRKFANPKKADVVNACNLFRNQTAKRLFTYQRLVKKRGPQFSRYHYNFHK